MTVQNQPQQKRVVHEIIASDKPKDKKIAMALQAATVSNKKDRLTVHDNRHGTPVFRRCRGVTRPFVKTKSQPDIGSMSALPPKPDIGRARWDVCFVPKADSRTAPMAPLSIRRRPPVGLKDGSEVFLRLCMQNCAHAPVFTDLIGDTRSIH